MLHLRSSQLKEPSQFHLFGDALLLDASFGPLHRRHQIFDQRARIHFPTSDWIPTTESLHPADLRPLPSEPERPARRLKLCRGLRQFFRNLNFFRRPELRAACPRIAIALFFCCRKRLFRKQSHRGLPCCFPEGIFNDAILQRVKTDHHHASSWIQNPGRRIYQRPQIVQFAVYEDSERLKGSGRRMNSPLFRIHWPGRG